MKRLTILAALAASVACLGALAADAQTVYTVGMYKNAGYTCTHGATPTGTSNGTFKAYQAPPRTVYATVTLTGAPADTTFTIRYVESGSTCYGPVDVTELTTDDHGNGSVHFTYPAHSGETRTWVTAYHSSSLVYRSPAIPINQ